MTAANLDARVAELLAMCDAEFGWDIDTFIALTREVLPELAARVGELEAERDRLRKIINDTRRVPEGSERAALWARADRNKGSKPWRTVWHLLRALETAEAERDAARAEAQRLREQIAAVKALCNDAALGQDVVPLDDLRAALSSPASEKP